MVEHVSHVCRSLHGVAIFAVGFVAVGAVARRRLATFALSASGVAGGAFGVLDGGVGQWQTVLAALLGVASGR